MIGAKHICQDGVYRFIYLIKNNINGKTYIGKHTTSNLKDRYFGSGTLLRKAIKKYGKKNFEFGYLVFVDSDEELNNQEREWIEFFRSEVNRGNYNLANGGGGGLSGELHPLYNVGHSDETKMKLSEFHQHRKRLTCPYCNKTMDYVNAKKYHFDKCSKNPNYNPNLIKCPHCHKTGTRMSAMVLWHFDNCKKNPKNKKEELFCPYCNKSSINHSVFKRFHFENCKENPNYKPPLREDIVCPHCGKVGKVLSAMKQHHFDNCKYKK